MLDWVRELNPMTGDPRRRGKSKQREGHVKIEAEIGVMWPQAKEHLEPPEVGRGRERSSSRASRGSTAANTLISDFWHGRRAGQCGPVHPPMFFKPTTGLFLQEAFLAAQQRSHFPSA